MNNPTSSNLNQAAHDKHNQKVASENAIIKEMLPFFLYAFIPVALTLMIAWTFGPKMSLH